MASEQARINAHVWRSGTFVERYANRILIPVEVLLLVRYRELLSRGRVLEAGCGAGRMLGYLVALGAEVHGVDIAPQMVEYCRLAYPQADVRVGDLAAIANVAEGTFDAVLVIDNVLDVFDDAERRRVLAELRDLLAPDGRLIFSSHNLAAWERRSRPVQPGAEANAESTPDGPTPARASAASRARQALAMVADRRVGELASLAPRVPQRLRNRRALAPLQRREAGYAIVNDIAHNYSLLHYYIGRDEQERQLADVGLELVECLDADGAVVPRGAPGDGPWLHYIAKRSTGAKAA